jgi:hypothetical protein
VKGGWAASLQVSLLGQGGSPSRDPFDTGRLRWIRDRAGDARRAAVALKDSAPKALRFMVEHAVLLLAAVLVVAVAAAVLDYRRTRRALARRVVFAALPTETFDPAMEEIVRFGGLLARTRRVAIGSRKTDAVWVRLTSLPGGRMLQVVEGPPRAESVLRLGGFAEVDLRRPETIDTAAMSAVQVHAADHGDDGARLGPSDADDGDDNQIGDAEDRVLGAGR